MNTTARSTCRLCRSATRAAKARTFDTNIRWASSSSRQWSTPLAKTLADAIETTGPLPVASYMRQCLTTDLGSGYYTSSHDGRDQFGQKGDFVTSPEISQIFGELTGLWVVAQWIAQGRISSGVQLVELGPGRGTLMDDMLRALRNFKSLNDSIDGIYLIEASSSLRAAQKKLLCGDDAVMEETDIGHKSKSKYSGVPIYWCEDIRLVPREADKSPFFIAHEFFDALPIHIFQSVKVPSQSSAAVPSITLSTGPRQDPRKPFTSSYEHQWREFLISPAAPDRLKNSLESPDFEMVMSKTPTPHSLYLPETATRYKALKKREDSIIEISPESLAYASELAVRIGGSAAAPSSLSAIQSARKTPPFTKSSPSGAALILDYGTMDTIPTNSLRGIRSHQMVSPFLAPGTVDLSADVDFTALAEAAIDGSPNVEVHGPVEQSAFLGAMGIKERAEMLVKKAGGNEETKKRIEQGWTRLVDRGPQGMGRIYKALAIVPWKEGKFERPVGFGGQVGL